MVFFRTVVLLMLVLGVACFAVALMLEANPNPQLAYGEDFAESAETSGVSYESLLQRIITTGLSWRPERQG